MFQQSSNWRNADKMTLKIGAVELTNLFIRGRPVGGATVPGIDIIDVKLPPDLAGKTDVDVIVTTTSGDVLSGRFTSASE